MVIKILNLYISTQVRIDGINFRWISPSKEATRLPKIIESVNYVI